MTLTLDRLREAVAGDAAIRRVQRLQPVGGPGDKIFPPTYLGDRGSTHIFETRRVAEFNKDGQASGSKDVTCVVLDSVQSQANRLEEALLMAFRARHIRFPHIVVSFANQSESLKIEGIGKTERVTFGEGEKYDLSDIGEITSLDAPHRVFDAIIRDSDVNSEDKAKPKAKEVGDRLKRLNLAKPTNATAVFDVCPASLLFGAWNSHGEGGGLGAKFARCIVSEIIAVEVREGMRGAFRIDPLNASKLVGIVGTRQDWKVAQPGEKGAVRPSEIGHSNIPASHSKKDKRNVWEAGVTADYALHTAVISFAGLRRLKFPDTKDSSAGHVVLAALALVALTQQDAMGYALRSRCDLVCEGRAPFKIVRPNGSTDDVDVEPEIALKIFNAAVDQAKKAGFAWNESPIKLVPKPRLLQLVALSRAKALRGESEGDGEGGDE